MMRFILCAMLILSASPAWATLWYVDSTASGANNGTSWTDAWTSRAAITGVLPGDTVYFSGGVAGKSYNTAVDWSPPSGTDGNPITFAVGQTAGHNGVVTFVKTGSSSTSAFVLLNTSRYVVFNGEVAGQRHMVIDGTAQGGHICYTQNQDDKHVAFRYIEWTAQIFQCQGAYMEISYSKGTIYDSYGPDYLITQFGVSGTSEGYGLSSLHHNHFEVGRQTLEGKGFDVLIWANSTDIYNNLFLSIDTNYTGSQHNDGLQVSGGYMRIYNNYFENFLNYPIYDEVFSDQTGWKIYNNVFVSLDPDADWQAHQGIAIGSKFVNHTLTNFLIANNTFIGNLSPPGDGTGGIRLSTNGFDMWVNSYVVNNLFYGNNEGVLTSAPTPPTISTNQLNGTLAFVNVSGSTLYPDIDVHLTAGATSAIDLGLYPLPAYLSDVYTTDAAGNTRAQGSSWDIGAYEYDQGGPSNPPVPPPQPPPAATGYYQANERPAAGTRPSAGTRTAR